MRARPITVIVLAHKSATTCRLTASAPMKRAGPIKCVSKYIDRASLPTGAAIPSKALAYLASQVIGVGDTLYSPQGVHAESYHWTLN